MLHLIPARPFAGLLIATLAFSTFAHAEEPKKKAGGADPDPAALVREMRSREAWVDKVKSLSVRTESTWHRTEEGLAIRKAEIKKQFPDKEPTAADHSDLRPVSHATFDMAFDDHRARWRRTSEHYQLEDLRVWDGARAIVHEHYVSGQEHYSLNNTPFDSVGQWMMLQLGWPRGGPHSFWFAGPENQMRLSFLGQPEAFFISGHAMAGATDCYVLDRKGDLDSILIGVADGHLYGTRAYFLSADHPQRQIVPIEIARDRGKHLKTTDDYHAWLSTLSKEVQMEIRAEWYDRMRPFRQKLVDMYYSDYKDFGGGRWMPMRHSADSYDTKSKGEPVRTSSRETRVLDVKIDEALPEGLFKVEFKEGVQVVDRSRQPVLIYKYKNDRTPEEWKQIEDDALARDEAAQRRAADMASAVGKPAPPFPKDAKWLNGEPMTWDSLKGRIVILDFWATWCGPCRNDFPLLTRLHEEREKLGYTVVGIHAADTDADEVKAFAEKFKLTHPLCIDASAKGAGAFGGEMFTGFHVSQIPHAFVIDGKGNVAGSGSLAEMSKRAQTLSAQNKVQ